MFFWKGEICKSLFEMAPEGFQRREDCGMLRTETENDDLWFAAERPRLQVRGEQNMKIVVIGACGHIGSYLVPRLV